MLWRALLSPNCHTILKFHVGSTGNAGFLTSSGILCKGACAAMRSSKKLWPRYNTTHITMQQVLYGLKCLSKARSGATTRAAALPGCLPRPSSPGRPARGQVPPDLDRWEIVLCSACKPCVCSRRAPYSAGGLRCESTKILQCCQKQTEWKQILVMDVS